MADSMVRRIGPRTAEPYQHRMMQSGRDALREGRSGAVLAPTGSGKSLLTAALVEDAIALGRQICVLHPDVELLRQNLAVMRDVEGFAAARVSAFIAANEALPIEGLMRNTFDADVVLATNASLVNKGEDPEFLEALAGFGSRRGVFVSDEGHRAAADKLGALLGIAAAAGASGIIETATPFRQDGRDPLAPFGASIETDLIAAAEHDEVLATGRIVRTIFDIAATEFEDAIGQDAQRLIEDEFIKLLGANKSIEQASKAAFSQFFRAEASESDRAIGELVSKAVVSIWRKRAKGHRVALIHADCVDFALDVARRAATERMPDGHPREGEYARVGFVIAEGVKVFFKGAEVDVAEIGWTRGGARTKVIELAREEGFDLLVNVSALGTGTDIPAITLNIIACREKALAPAKQCGGRGERAAPGLVPPKTSQQLVDIGSTIYNIFNDVDAIRRGSPELSRRFVKCLSPQVRRQIEMWFDADPSLPSQVARRTKRVADQGGEEREVQEEDTVDFDGPPDPRELPEPVAVARGIEAIATNRRDSRTGAWHVRVAALFDMQAMFAFPAGEDFPRFVAVCFDEATANTGVFITRERDTARGFAAFMGVEPSRAGRRRQPPSPGQVGLLARCRGRPALKALGRIERFETLEHASTGLALLANDRVMSMLDTAADAYLRKALNRAAVNYPLRAVVLDRADQISPPRLRMLAAWTRLRGMLAAHAPDRYAGAPQFSVVSYDPTTPAYAKALFHSATCRFTEVSGTEQSTRLEARLRQGVTTGRVVGMSPDAENGDAGLRRKAGLKARDPGVDEREHAFLAGMTRGWTVKGDHAMHDADLPLARNLSIAFTTSEECGPVAAMIRAVAGLALDTERLAGTTLALEVAAAVEARRGLTISIDLGVACGAFATSLAPAQRRTLKALERCERFKEKLASIQGPAQGRPVVG